MRKIYTLVSAYLSIVVIFSSCSKQSVNDSIAPASSSVTEVVRATIPADQEYQFIVTNAGEVSVAKQAINYRISTTELDTKTGKTIYRYLPSLKFVGSEEIILANRKAVYNTSSSACFLDDDQRSSPDNLSYHTTYTKLLLQVK